MKGFSPEALAYFESHAIKPEVAAASGVQEANGYLVYPDGGRRALVRIRLTPSRFMRLVW